MTPPLTDGEQAAGGVGDRLHGIELAGLEVQGGPVVQSGVGDAGCEPARWAVFRSLGAVSAATRW